jgi:hypothetical protein
MNLNTGTATAAAPQKVRIGGRKLTWEAAFAIAYRKGMIGTALSRESFPEERAILRQWFYSIVRYGTRESRVEFSFLEIAFPLSANKRRSRLTGGPRSRHIAAS